MSSSFFFTFLAAGRFSMSLFCRCFQCQICLCSSRAWFMAQQVGQISIAVFFSTRCTRVYLFLHKENRIKEFKRKHFIVQKRFSGSNFNCDRPFFSFHWLRKYFLWPLFPHLEFQVMRIFTSSTFTFHLNMIDIIILPNHSSRPLQGSFQN